MSFIYGGTNTESLAGVTATLSAWPSLGGLSVESEAVPGRDARFYAGASRSHTAFTFDVVITGATPAEVGARRDSFVGLLDPSRGPRPLVLETDTAWRWEDVLVSESIEWDRVGWDYGVGFTLRADVSFETQGEASAREVTPQRVALPSSGSFTLGRGNTSAFPRLEFAGGAACIVKVGAFTVNVAATPAGTVVLDWESFEFILRNASGARTGSAVRYMSNFERPVLPMGEAVAVSVSRGGSSIPVVLFPNARRI